MSLEAIRLQEEYRNAIEARFQCLLDLDRFTDAIPALEAFVSTEPLRERALAQLMEALYRVGRQTEALRAYRNYNDLIAESGLEPSDNLQRMESAILTDDLPPAPRPPPPNQLRERRTDRATDPLHHRERRHHARLRHLRQRPAPGQISELAKPPRIRLGDTHLATSAKGTLSRQRLLLRYDERGCGLSDRIVADVSFEAWVNDLEAVVDAAGFDRFPLLGVSQGGAVAIAYTVRHPERVSHLILSGAYIRGRRFRDPTPAQIEEIETTMKLIELGWGQDNAAFRHVFTRFFIPDGAAEQHRWFDELQRKSTSPENALKIFQTFATIDVRQEALQVHVPTLVIHSRGDAQIPFALGREAASVIPGARLVALDSNNHLPLEQEQASTQYLNEIHTFLGGQE